MRLTPMHNREVNNVLHIRPRYYRWFVDVGVEWRETNTRHASLDWEIPLSQVALVLVDVWAHHYLLDAEERANKIIEQKFKPLLAACRRAGLQVIHAPGPVLARALPQYVGDSKQKRQQPEETWPPQEFRQCRGDYTAYKRPTEPRASEIQQLQADRTIHPAAEPTGSETVIATGDELHQICQERGILFLLFAGFNTNACILERDYGLREFSRRGYKVLLLRDCTTGMESFDSQPDLWQTRAAIEKIEMFLGYTVTADEVICSLTTSLEE